MKLSFVALFACAGLVCVSANAQTPITSCGTTISADGGNTYVLTGDLTNSSTSGPCIEFDNQTAQDLLDCQGYTLTSTVARDLILIQNYGNLMVKNCTITYGTSYVPTSGPAVEVRSGGTFQTAQGLTTGQSNIWNYASVLCSGGQQVIMQYDLLNQGTISLTNCSSATYPSSLNDIDEGWTGFTTGFRPSECFYIEASDYVTLNYVGTKTCPATIAIIEAKSSNYLTITNGDFDGNWDMHTTDHSQGVDDGIIICGATECGQYATGTGQVTGLDIEYTQVERVYDACLEFVGWASYGSVFHLDCSYAGVAAVGAYWDVSMDNMTFNYVFFDNSPLAHGPFYVVQADSTRHGHGEGLTNLAIYNTSYDVGKTSNTSNLGYSFSTPFDNYSNITVGNNTFGHDVYFQPTSWSVTDNGGNVCVTSTPAYITCH